MASAAARETASLAPCGFRTLTLGGGGVEVEAKGAEGGGACKEVKGEGKNVRHGILDFSGINRIFYALRCVRGRSAMRGRRRWGGSVQASACSTSSAIQIRQACWPAVRGQAQ